MSGVAQPDVSSIVDAVKDVSSSIISSPPPESVSQSVVSATEAAAAAINSVVSATAANDSSHILYIKSPQLPVRVFAFTNQFISKYVGENFTIPVNQTALETVSTPVFFWQTLTEAYWGTDRMRLLLAELNARFTKYTSLSWAWQRLPFPPVLLTYAFIVLSATFIVIVSCRTTVHRPRNSGDPDKSSPLYHPFDDSEAVQDDLFAKAASKLKQSLAATTDKRRAKSYLKNLKELKKYRQEMVGATEAYLMPVFGAVGLLGLYFAYKYFNAVNIQTVMSTYFAIVAFFSVVATFSLSLKSIARIVFNKTIPHWRISIADDNEYHNSGIEPGFDKAEQELEEEKEKKRLKKQKKLAAKNKDKSEKLAVSKHKKSNEDTMPKIELCSPVKPIEQYANIYFSLGDILGIPVSLALVALQYYTGNWIFGNLLAAAVAIQGISTLRIDSFKTGLIMLAGLFLYDIYFVFGTDVMVTVATKVQVPIKLEIPRPMNLKELESGIDPSHSRATAMLGLGDVVVPAMYLALCLRFDIYQFYEKAITYAYGETPEKNPQAISLSDIDEDEARSPTPSADDQEEQEERILLPFHLAQPYPKPYFSAGIVAYVLGLIVTIFVMHVFKAGQPALLYLCPAIAFSTISVAYYKGELKQLFKYRDQEPDEEDDDKDEEDSDKEE